MYYKDHRLMKLKISAEVMGQIKCIIDHFTTEVSWFGDIVKEGDTVTITKIYLFPQVVTGGTFRTDTPQVSELYDQWYENKLNEIAEQYDRTHQSLAIMQYNGHSHVNAACQASSEDMNFRKSRDGLNVYSIHNKQGGVDWEIWDGDVVYEHFDIDVLYEDSIFDVATDYVLTPVFTTPSYNGGGYGRSAYQQKAMAQKLSVNTPARRNYSGYCFEEEELYAEAMKEFLSTTPQ